MYALADARNMNENEIAQLIRLTGLIDEDFYLKQYPDVGAASVDPALHFVRHGYKERRSPRKGLDGKSKNVGEDSFGNYLKALAAENEAYRKPQIIRSGSYEAAYDLPLMVNWPITEMCNYACSYCFGQTKIDKNKFIPLHKFLIALENIRRLNRSAYYFTLAGGEPTAHPAFLDLIYAIKTIFKERVKNITFVSNGSRNAEFFKGLSQVTTSINTRMIISIHQEYAEIAHIRDIIKIMSDSCQLTFSLMFHPNYFEKTKEWITALCEARKEHNFWVTVALLRSGPNYDRLDERYTPEMIAWQKVGQQQFNNAAIANKTVGKKISVNLPEIFRDIAVDGLIKHQRCSTRPADFAEGLYNFRDFYCVTGAHMLSICPDGSWRGAVCNAAKILGNIYDENQFTGVEPFQIVKCPYPNCGCSANDPLMKFQDENEANSYLKILKERQASLYRQHQDS